MIGKARHLANAPKFWLFALFLWAATLFVLSSLSKTLPDGGPEIPHIDKVLHFGYFFGGGFILGTYCLLRSGTGASFARRFLLPLAIFAVLGILDEYHQTFTPGRSGNDPFDWLADVLGAGTGIVVANLLHTRLKRLSSPVTEKS